jgi:hypothetical protein
MNSASTQNASSPTNQWTTAELTTKKVKIEHPLHWQGLEIVEECLSLL